MKSIISVLVTILLACNSQSNTKSDKKADANQLSMYEKTFDSMFVSTGMQPCAYVVLPNAGCGGCISSASNLLAEYVRDTMPVKFILTNIASYKAARNSFGNAIISSPLVYIDSANVFYSKFPQLYQIYPIIIYMDGKGNVNHFEYVDPDNPSALSILRNYVDTSMRNHCR